MKMSEEQIKAMVIMNIIDNCTMELDNTGQERYSLNEQKFGKCVDTLVKNINAIHCCKIDNEQLPDAEKEKLIEDAYWLNLQNLSGREDFEEAFKLGIEIGVNETLEKLQG